MQLPGDLLTRVDRIDALLPQTQCTKCGYAGCRPYAEAIDRGTADINQCPPGGAAGIHVLSALLDRPARPLNPANGIEKPLAVAVIDESLCIGCTLCIAACPVDCIVGASKKMHTVIGAQCTGCDLCVAPCPMDCIAMVTVAPPRTWTRADADSARERYAQREARRAHERARKDARLTTRAVVQQPGVAQPDTPSEDHARRKSVIDAAIARARARRAAPGSPR